MCAKGTTVATIITGNKRKPISTTVRMPANVQPTARITIQATWYQRDWSAWKETLDDLSLYTSQITSAATGPRKPVTRFTNTERWAKTDQVFSSLGLMVVVVGPVWILLSLEGSEPGSSGLDVSGSGSMP